MPMALRLISKRPQEGQLNSSTRPNWIHSELNEFSTKGNQVIRIFHLLLPYFHGAFFTTQFYVNECISHN